MLNKSYIIRCHCTTGKLAKTNKYMMRETRATTSSRESFSIGLRECGVSAVVPSGIESETRQLHETIQLNKQILCYTLGYTKRT